MKKFLLLFFILSASLLAYKYDKIYRYFAERRYYKILVDLNLSKTCYRFNEYQKIFALEGFNYEQEDLKITNLSLEKIKKSNSTFNNNLKIPPITHLVYLSSKNNPKPLKEFYLENIKATTSKLNKHNIIWEHNIWTNLPDLFPDEIKQIKGIKIRNIAELNKHQLYGILEKTLDENNENKAKFSQVSDLVRFIVMQTIGGVYRDTDYEIYDAEQLIQLMNEFDFIAGRELAQEYSYYGTAFIASKANHPILNEAINLNLRNYAISEDFGIIPDYIKYVCFDADKVYFNAPPLLTLAYFKKNNIEQNNDLILPPWVLFNVNFARNKNGGCSYQDFSREKFESNDNNLATDLIKFSNNFREASPKKAKDHNINTLKTGIYYDNNSPQRNEFKIIGADMFCGSWVVQGENKRNNYPK